MNLARLNFRSAEKLPDESDSEFQFRQHVVNGDRTVVPMNTTTYLDYLHSSVTNKMHEQWSALAITSRDENDNVKDNRKDQTSSFNVHDDAFVTQCMEEGVVNIMTDLFIPSSFRSALEKVHVEKSSSCFLRPANDVRRDPLSSSKQTSSGWSVYELDPKVLSEFSDLFEINDP